MNLGEKYLMVLSRGPTREQIEQVEQSSGGEAMNFRFWVQLYLRREDSAEYRPAWMTDEKGDSLYDIVVEMKIVTFELMGEPNLARLELEIVEGMEKHPDPRCTGVKYLWLLRAMYKGWSLKVLYDKQCCVGIVEEIFQKMPNVQTSWEVRTGISHEARTAMMPRELAESRLHHRL